MSEFHFEVDLRVGGEACINKSFFLCPAKHLLRRLYSYSLSYSYTEAIKEQIYIDL